MKYYSFKTDTTTTTTTTIAKTTADDIWSKIPETKLNFPRLFFSSSSSTSFWNVLIVFFKTCAHWKYWLSDRFWLECIFTFDWIPTEVRHQRQPKNALQLGRTCAWQILAKSKKLNSFFIPDKHNRSQGSVQLNYISNL